MEAVHRPAVRILCFDGAHRLLLLHWRDPFDGTWLWEPPGGGIEAGETPLQAARRELAEETGLNPAAVHDRCLPVQRDFRWNGRRYVGPEQFFMARFLVDQPPLTRTGLMPDEQVNLHDHVWVGPSELTVLTDRVEPPQLPAVAAALTGQAPWAPHSG